MGEGVPEPAGGWVLARTVPVGEDPDHGVGVEAPPVLTVPLDAYLVEVPLRDVELVCVVLVVGCGNIAVPMQGL